MSERFLESENAVARVLLVDDDPVVAAIYKNLLTAHGFEVEVAEDGEQGFRSVQRRMPDAVLLDLDLPKMNGMQWLSKIRSRAGTRGLPVVILTAGTIKRQLKAAKRSDATFVLAKSTVHPSTVVEAVNMASGRVRVLT